MLKRLALAAALLACAACVDGITGPDLCDESILSSGGRDIGAVNSCTSMDIRTTIQR